MQARSCCPLGRDGREVVIWSHSYGNDGTPGELRREGAVVQLAVALGLPCVYHEAKHLLQNTLIEFQTHYYEHFFMDKQIVFRLTLNI